MCVHIPDALHPSHQSPPYNLSSSPVTPTPSLPSPALTSGSISLATLPSSSATSLSSFVILPVLPLSPPPPHSLIPPAPSLDACPLPPSRPASCVSQPCSDVGGEGVGGWMTHSVMMQFHNTQLHSPTDRGTDERQPLAPKQLASFATSVLSP